MAKEKAAGCAYGCPLCRLYEASGAVQDAINECVPREVSTHLNRAAREMLLAVRALLNEGLESVARGTKQGSRRKVQRVKVE
jgi:hypothetical protein